VVVSMREKGGREVDHLLDEKDFFKKRLRKGHKAVFSMDAYLSIFPYDDIYKQFSRCLARNKRLWFSSFGRNRCRLSGGHKRRIGLAGVPELSRRSRFLKDAGSSRGHPGRPY